MLVKLSLYPELLNMENLILIITTKFAEVVTSDGRRVTCVQRDTVLDMSQMALPAFPERILRCTDLETLNLARNYIR